MNRFLKNKLLIIIFNKINKLLTIVFFLNISLSYSQKINYVIDKNQNAIIYFTFAYSPQQNTAYIFANNIIIKNEIYPLGRISTLKNEIMFAMRNWSREDKSVTDDSFDYINKDFFNLTKRMNFNILDFKLLSDTLVISPDTQYIRGGQTYHILSNEYNKTRPFENFQYFYVIFNIKADILTVYENADYGLVLWPGQCNLSLQYAKNKSNPTKYIIDVKKEWKLSKKQMIFFGARKLKNMFYKFNFC